MYEMSLVVFQILIVFAVLQDVIGRRVFNWGDRQLDRNIYTVFALGGLLLLFRIGMNWVVFSLVTVTLSFLIRFLLNGLFRKKRIIDDVEDFNDERDDDIEKIDAEVSVPEEINPNGLYAIFVSQAEMYDLGNTAFIGHYLIYDEKNQSAVDVTAQIEKAPLLSVVPEGKVIDNCSDIRAFLHKKRTPQYIDNEGIKKFIVMELPASVVEGIQGNLAAFVEQKKKRELLLDQFKPNLEVVREMFFSNSCVNPQDDTMVKRLNEMKAGKYLTHEEVRHFFDEE